jgi:hypothetical protein
MDEVLPTEVEAGLSGWIFILFVVHTLTQSYIYFFITPRVVCAAHNSV